MSLKSFVVAAGMVAGLGACAGGNFLEDQINRSVDSAGKDNRTDEEKQWDWVLERKGAAENRPRVTDVDSFKAAMKGVDDYAGQLQIYRDFNCKEARAAKCDEADRLSADASKLQLAAYEEAMGVPAIEFDMLQDNVIDLERNPANAGLNIDPWMEELGKRKHEYWAGELSKRGGTLAGYVEANGDPQCATYNADPSKSDVKALDYTFTKKDKIWIKCVFPKSLAEYTRNDSDYWRVEIRWGSEWEDIKMTYDIKTPDKNTIVWSIQGDVVGEKIQKKIDATNFVYRGTWLRAQLMYTVRWITGQEWQGDKWVDVWKHEQIAGSSVYLKWK